jgi:hypothetical protein
MQKVMVILCVVLLIAQSFSHAKEKEKKLKSMVRETSSMQDNVKGDTVRTVELIQEIAKELSYNRLSRKSLEKHIDLIDKSLDKVGNEYMKKAVKELRAMIASGEITGQGNKLTNVLQLQKKIMEILDQIKNAKLAAQAPRMLDMLGKSIKEQKEALEKTKKMLMDKDEKVPIGKKPEELTKEERERLEDTANKQEKAADMLKQTLDEIKEALGQEQSDPQQKEMLENISEQLEQKNTLQQSQQAGEQLEQNQATQAMRNQMAVLSALQQALQNAQESQYGQMAMQQQGNQQLQQLQQQSEQLQSLINEQQGLMNQTQQQSENASAEDMRRLEAQQDQLAQQAQNLSNSMQQQSQAQSSMQQATVQMEQAENNLGQGQRNPALQNQQQALDHAKKALDDVQKQMKEMMARLDNSVNVATPGQNEGQESPWSETPTGLRLRLGSTSGGGSPGRIADMDPRFNKKKESLP